MADLPRSLKSLLLLTLAAAAGGAGCSAKIPIVQIPHFYTPELKTIAVVPFRNQSTGKNAGQVIADKLAAALMANGSYKVYNRNDLKALMDESDLQIALGADSPAAAATFKKATNVQAILTGAVTTYSATSQSQRRQDPQYAYTKQGRKYLTGYRTYVLTRNEANVSVTATLIRVSDGTTIAATPAPARARVASEGEPPKQDPYACISDATDQVVFQLVEQFAPIRKVIKVNTSKALRTASDLYDNKWSFTKQFNASDEKMYVVVELPLCCDRNRFRLVIVKKDQREELAGMAIVWGRKASVGYSFSPKALAAKAGPGQFQVKFYSGPEPVIIQDFRIR